jgi:hypothetical protein
MHANAADRSLSAKRGLFPSLHTVYRTPFSPMRVDRAPPRDWGSLVFAWKLRRIPPRTYFRAPDRPPAKTPYSCKQFSPAGRVGQLTLCYRLLPSNGRKAAQNATASVSLRQHPGGTIWTFPRLTPRSTPSEVFKKNLYKSNTYFRNAKGGAVNKRSKRTVPAHRAGTVAQPLGSAF